MKRNIVRSIASVFSGNIILLVYSVLLTPIIVRILGPSDYGDYAYIMSVVGVVTVLTDTTFQDSVRKFASEDIDSEKWVAGVLGLHVRGSVVSSVLVAGLLVLSTSLLSSRVGIPQRMVTYVYLSAIIILARPLFGLSYSLLMAYNREGVSQVVKVTKRTLSAFLGISLAYIGFGVQGLLAGTVFGLIAGGILGFVLLQKNLDINPRLVNLFPEDGFPSKDIFRYLSLNAVLILAFNTLYHLDIILVRVFVGNPQTGYYKGAIVIAEFLWFVPNTVRTVFLHSTSELWAEGDVEKISELASLATRYTLLLSILLAIGVATLGDIIVPLYFGAGFEASVVPLLILLPGAVGFAAVRPIIAVGQGKGSLRTLFFATIGSSILNIVLNLALIPPYGLIGAAVATSVSYLSMFAFQVAAAHKIGFDPLSDLRPIPVCIVALITGLFSFALKSTVRGDILSLLVVPPAVFVFFVALGVLVGAIDRQELRVVADKLPIGNRHR